MANKMNDTEQESAKKSESKQRTGFLSSYIQQRKVILSILISLYIVMNIIAVMLTTYYYFVTILLYNGIIMILLTAGIFVVIVIERDYFWAFLSSIFIGLVPTIELVVGLAIAPLDSLNLAFVIVFLIISIGLVFAPSISIYYLLEKEKKKNENEIENGEKK